MTPSERRTITEAATRLLTSTMQSCKCEACVARRSLIYRLRRMAAVPSTRAGMKRKGTR